MIDLNSKIFYKAKFCVEAIEEMDLLWAVILKIKAWLTFKCKKESICIDESYHRWSKFKGGCKIYDSKDNRVYAESIQCVNENGELCWACKIIERQRPEENFAPREWTTEIGYRQIAVNVAEISYVVTFRDQPGFIGLCADIPEINVPTVIRKLLTDRKLICLIGDNQLSLKPKKLNVGDGIEFQNLLLSHTRKTPLIFISARPKEIGSSETELLVNPKSLAESVAGNALVYYSDSVDFSEELRCLLNTGYGCAGGNVRIYLPNINNSINDQYRHRFLSAAFIEEKGANCVLNIFRKAVAQDFFYYEKLVRLDDCKRMSEKISIKTAYEKKMEESEGAIWDLLTETEEKLQTTEITLGNVQDEYEREKANCYALSIQNEALKEKASHTTELELAVSSLRSTINYPSNPLEIASYFELIFKDKLAFTERARKSLVSCKSKNEILWEVFYYMATILCGLHENDPVNVGAEFKKQTGYQCSRGQGPMTRKDAALMREYQDVYEGKNINIEAHVKNGVKEADPKFIRVYYYYDAEIKKIIIGHCGEHLENYSTRKIK